MEGYGLEQAVLKFAKYGRQHRPRVVVLGVTFEEITRSGLPFLYFMLEEFSARFENPEDAKERLYTTGTLAGSGHLSPEGNALAAKLLAARIEAFGVR